MSLMKEFLPQSVRNRARGLGLGAGGFIAAAAIACGGGEADDSTQTPEGRIITPIPTEPAPTSTPRVVLTPEVSVTVAPEVNKNTPEQRIDDYIKRRLKPEYHPTEPLKLTTQQVTIAGMTQTERYAEININGVKIRFQDYESPTGVHSDTDILITVPNVNARDVGQETAQTTVEKFIVVSQEDNFGAWNNFKLKGGSPVKEKLSPNSKGGLDSLFTYRDGVSTSDGNGTSIIGACSISPESPWFPEGTCFPEAIRDGK